jgi:hypothetical protein
MELKMHWKFWKRGDKKKDGNPDQSAVAQPGEDGKASPALQAAASAKEILGLQKLIGNQAVLQIMGRNANSAKVNRLGT